jgi:hypothetical protein
MKAEWIVRVKGFGISAHIVGADGRPLCRAPLKESHWRPLAEGEAPPAGRCGRCVARLTLPANGASD